MPRIRPELIRGIALLSVFLLFVVSTELLVPFPIQHSNYASVSLLRLRDSPATFEGVNVSSKATIVLITDHGSYSIAETEEGPSLVFAIDDVPPTRSRILVRGVSWVSTNNTISVHEFHTLDFYSSIIRSIPGIILFIVLFFMIFRIDFSQLAFVLRRR